MRQQINLHQPILREEPKLFGAKAAFRAFVAVVVTLALISVYGALKVQRLAQTTQSLREQQAQQEQSLSTASSMRAGRATSAALTARVKRSEAQVAAATRALGLLKAGAAGRTTGFAARLEALARQHVDGVWIDRMALSGSTEAMSLGGATFNPDLVPKYLSNLARESVLAGARFDELAIERQREKSSAQVRFRASSVTLPEPAVTEKEEGST